MTLLRIVKLLAIGALALTAVSPVAQGSGGTAITSCGQLVTTNAFLTQDLYCPGQDAIVVGAPGITIDLKGFTLRGDRTGGNDGIVDTGYDGVTIRNGVVRNFYLGMNLYAGAGADGISVSKLIVSGNLFDGILVSGDSATIQSLTASGNGGDGVDVEGNGTRIQSSTASGNGNAGFLVSGDSATIQSSTTTGNDFHGIAVFSDFATIQSSTASGNGDDGIHAEGNLTNVKSSTAAGNVLNGIDVRGNGTKIQSSTASGNGSEGIYAYGDGTVVKGNRAEANGFHSGVSDLLEVGINATGWSFTPPVGTNTALGNDHPQECFPDTLC
jgi:putative surface-exposed virulence protein